MATRQRPTDVVIIGLGATGGVAALPLTRAGLNVVGLEAGQRLLQAGIALPGQLDRDAQAVRQLPDEGDPERRH